MKNADWSITIILAVLIGVAVFTIAYSTAHWNGYELGHRHSQYYYEATNQFPSPDWIKDTFRRPGRLCSMDSIEAIWDSLKPYGDFEK